MEDKNKINMIKALVEDFEQEAKDKLVESNDLDKAKEANWVTRFCKRIMKIIEEK